MRNIKDQASYEDRTPHNVRSPQMMYHGTSSKLLPDIIKYGLQPQSEALRQKYIKYIGDSENPDYVSVTSNMQTAWMFADITASATNGEMIVISIFISDPSSVYTDPEEFPHKIMFLHEGPIDVSDLRRVTYEDGSSKRFSKLK